MRISTLVDELKARNIHLWVESRSLRYRAPKGTVTDEIRQTLGRHKKQIIDMLIKDKAVEREVQPLSYNQQSLWFMHQIAPASCCYTVAATCRITCPVDEDALTRAIHRLVERHPILCTIYTSTSAGSEHQAVQYVDRAKKPEVRLIDASKWPEKELKLRVEGYYAEPFDLSSEPPLRVFLFQRSAEDFIFMLTVHHITCDAISLKIVLDDLFKLYDAEATGRTVELSDVKIRYSDFTIWQKNMLNLDVGQRLKSYWINRLSGPLPVLNLPEDFKRPSVPSYQGGSYYFKFDKELYKSISAYCHEASVTKYVFLLSAFQLFLKKYGQSDDVLVGTPVVGRSRQEFMKVCGNFINTVVMRGLLTDDQTFEQHLLNTKRTVFRAIDHQDYPFSRLVEELSPVRDYSRTPVFQAMFNLLDQKALGAASMFLHSAEFDKPADLGGLKILPFPIDQEEGQFDLTLEIIDTTDRFACVLKYNLDVFAEETVESFAKVFADYVLLALEPPGTLLEKFPGPALDKDSKSICIGATFTAEVLETPLAFWTETLGLKQTVSFAPYNQVFQELLSPESQFWRNIYGVNVLLIRLEDWWDSEKETPDTDLRQKSDEFCQAIETFSSASKIPILVCFCPPSESQIRNTVLNDVEQTLTTFLNGIGNIYPVPGEEILKTIEVDEYDEPLGIDAGHVPYTEAFFASLSYTIARKIYSITGKPYKAIVLDCDQTLWKGVVGEDGPMGVHVDPARKMFQQLMVEKHQTGTLICLCSKNIEQDVFEVFEQNPQMVLKKEHISFSKINWSPKSQNLRELAKEINIGLDSFIFIDDNPVECAEVRANCPEVLTLQLPFEPEKLNRFTKHIWAFDHLKLTKEDRERAKLYKKETERNTLLQSSLTFEDFITNLGLKISISEMRTDQIPRVSQLTLRTNQFNFTTIRRNESEIFKLHQSDSHTCLVAEVTDRFGDYGLVGVVIFEKKDTAIYADTFLLSCRVLGRGVEHKLFQYLGKVAIDNRLESVHVDYAKTKKNQPAIIFLQSVGKEFEQHDGDKTIFRFPAQNAIHVTFSPSGIAKAGDDDESPKTKNTSSDTTCSYDLVLQEIAERLSNVNNILEAINLRGKKYITPKVRQGINIFEPPATKTEKNVAAVWSDTLGFDDISVHDNFFDLGGRSILMPGIVIRLSKMYEMKISIIDMFLHPSIRLISEYIDNEKNLNYLGSKQDDEISYSSKCAETSQGVESKNIAIIGMSGRFPGAADISVFWKNILNGEESITTFSDDELKRFGVPEALINNPKYIKRSPVLDGSDKFDAGFFSYTPREAEKIDPQQRIFLECAWDVFEDAGYIPDQYKGPVSVFAGCGMNNYLLKNVLARPELMESILNFQTFIGNDKDFLSTRVSYKLGLKGPSITVQSACSTSLVAIQLACQSLLAHQSDLAIGGGVSLQTPRLKGYLHTEGEIFSVDGHCRPFSNDASGTILGEGVGVVLLKRLDDAIRDNDHIYAVIKGAALNNDGHIKVGYTAPGVQGQADVIAMAQEQSHVHPESIGYIEAHGTGTPMGDPIEVAALTKVFRKKTNKRSYCAIGSLKSNIGHLDVAAGVAGLIKASLMVKYGMLPPTLNVKEVNPELNISESPFYVNDTLRKWDTTLSPRRAGVSSFGVGGTNAHVVIEEAPEKFPISIQESPWHLFILSAQTAHSLEQRQGRLRDYLVEHSEVHAGDVSFTLQNGRKAFRHRSAFVCQDVKAVVEALSTVGAGPLLSGVCQSENRPVAFMLTGQGSQYVNMAKDLFDTEDFFRKQMEECTKILEPLIGCDLAAILYPEEKDREEAEKRLNDTEIAQPALFALEYSLAKLYMHWNIKPKAMIGHSLGEYVAACLAGVFSLEDGLKLVSERGRLMQKQPQGDMLAVALSENDILAFIKEPLSLAVINAPNRCVVSGPSDAVSTLHDSLKNGLESNVQCTILHTSHAFHSSMMEGAVEPLNDLLKTIPLKKPNIPFVSNVTGTWITDSEATDPDYWSRHLRHTVRFSEGIQTLLSEQYVLLEVGPGQTLLSLAKQNSDNREKKAFVFSSIKHPQSKDHDRAYLLKTLAQLWISGVNIDWDALNKDMGYGRIPLPGYPFERQRFWIEPMGCFTGYPATVNPYSDMNGDNQYFNKGIQPETILYSRPSTVSNDYERPSSEIEEGLVKIWQNVLGIDQIGVHDNFFELGGDSLIATQIISRIRDSFTSDLSIRKLFEFPTITGLAAILSREGGRAEGKKDEAIKSVIGEEDDRQLSLAQQRLWFINQLEPLSPAYNIVQAVKLKGELHEDILQKAFDSILKRHDVLRAVFKKIEGRPVLEYLDMDSIKIKNIHVAETQGEDEVRRYIAQQAPILFDLEQGPLLRAYVFQIGTSENIFAIVMHHIIADGWSMGVWMRELSMLYNSLQKGLPSPLVDLPIQYSDYARWQKKWVTQNDLKKQESYWKDLFEGELPVIQLSSDFPRPVAPKYTGRHQSIRFSPELTKNIQQMAKQENTTVYVVLLSAYFALLQKYSNQNDIVVGTPYANRDRLEIEGLIGFFINMVPIRMAMAEKTNSSAMIRKVHQLVFDALANKDVPFEKLVEILHPERTLNYHPIFQVMFAFQNFPLPTDESADLKFMPIVMDRGATEFELSLYMWEENKQLCGVFEYSDEIFKGDTIKRMVGHFQTLLRGIVEQPSAIVQEIEILTEPEKKLMLIDWNDNRIEYPNNQCIHDLFDIQTEKIPDSVALVHKQDRVTYSELKNRANQLATDLAHMGIGPDDLVGICVERSISMIVGMLAILKAGGAYVPLDPGYPVERLNFMVSDSNSPVVMTQKKFEHLFSDSVAKLVFLDSLLQSPCNENIPAPPPQSKQNNLAYVIYTSGSTGVPKGVAIEHSSAVALFAWAKTVFTEDEIGGMLASTSVCFDLSVFEIFLPLTTGGKIILAENALELPGLPALNEVRLINTVPSAIVELLRNKSIPRNITTVNLAGEPLKQEVVEQLYALKFIQRVYDLYGPSEDTTYSTWTLRKKGGRSTIGKPISNTRLYLVDQFRIPVPVGVPGEIYIGGDGLAREYLNRVDLTKEKFVPDFMSDDTLSRLYRTGDLAKFYPDGNIEFIGRIDHQIKLRGFRIELGEIEAALVGHKQINQCVAVVREDIPGDKRLVAYMVPSPTYHENDSGLRQYLKTKLPEHMIPQHFMILSSFPMTSNGKIDRKLLPQPVGKVKADDDDVSKMTEIETQLLVIWKRIIGLDNISIHDNFFEIGGHSLLSVQIFSEIYNLTGINLPLAVIFKAPTVRELAENIEKAGGKIKPRKKITSFLKNLRVASAKVNKTGPHGWSHLVAIKPGGSRLPIFCMHAIGGNVLNYNLLASELDDDQPVYGLQSSGLDGLTEPYSSIEEMAERYIEEMKQVQPNGPYYVVGGSMGGFIALEVAQKLKRQGQDIALLAMFDTYAPSFFKKDPSFSKHPLIFRIFNKLNALIFSKRYGTTVMDQFKVILDSVNRNTAILLKLFLCKFYLSIHIPIPHKLRYWYVEQKNWKPVLNYSPKQYHGNLALFAEPQFNHGLELDVYKGWADYIEGNIDVIDIPAKHLEFMEEPLLVEEFYKYMQKYNHN